MSVAAYHLSIGKCWHLINFEIIKYFTLLIVFELLKLTGQTTDIMISNQLPYFKLIVILNQLTYLYF